MDLQGQVDQGGWGSPGPGAGGGGSGELSGSNNELNRSNRNSIVVNNSVKRFSENPLEDFRKSVASKLKQLCLNRPLYSRVKITDPAHANIIGPLDNNL